MKKEHLIKIKADAQETLNSINCSKNLTKDEYLLLGASLAISNHADEPNRLISPLNSGLIPTASKIEYQGKIGQITGEFWSAVDNFEMYRSEETKQAMIQEFKKLLEIYADTIVELRHKIKHPECISLLKEFSIQINHRI